MMKLPDKLPCQYRIDAAIEQRIWRMTKISAEPIERTRKRRLRRHEIGAADDGRGNGEQFIALTETVVGRADRRR